MSRRSYFRRGSYVSPHFRAGHYVSGHYRSGGRVRRTRSRGGCSWRLFLFAVAVVVVIAAWRVILISAAAVVLAVAVWTLAGVRRRTRIKLGTDHSFAPAPRPGLAITTDSSPPLPASPSQASAISPLPHDLPVCRRLDDDGECRNLMDDPQFCADCARYPKHGR